ncbi:MAG: pantetheine-phosphate adenylyltransferase [Muribaculaceae bacterium]|nr:pantetheine-phosphate adenylyltransferase [Muribaculaceae bacterium]
MKAIFPGSFDPFTIGHLDIVARALKGVNEVVIAFGINPAKHNATDVEEKVRYIEALFAECPRVSVLAYSGLTIDAARRVGAQLIVRGFRNAADADYERSLALTNLLVSDNEIDTWLIPARPELECISSSMVRELRHFNHPIEQYLPSHEDCTRLCS